MRTNWLTSGAVLLLSSTSAGHLTAHHSAAMFDRTRVLTLHGTVKEFQWTNPHCFIQLAVPSEGKIIEWSVELGSPGELYRSGWRPGTLRAGQNVVITVHPTGDGSPGGLYSSGATTDGAPLGAKLVPAKVP